MSEPQIEIQGGSLRDHLLAIRDKRGALTPKIVLDEARDPNHPLHGSFEWDDSVAGEKYRLGQARKLLQVRYKQEVGGEVRDLRAFMVSRPTAAADDDPDAEERPDSEYVPVEEIILDPIAKQLMLNQMARDWRNFERRYRGMKEFADFILGQLTEGSESA